MVAHLPGAVVHVQHRAGGKLCAPHKAGKLIRCHPDGGRKCCGAAVSIVILQQSVQAHQSAHAAAADKGICPVRQGAEILVDQRLEPVDEPAHGGLSLAVKVAVGGVIEAVGGILHQTLVVCPGVALDGRHDQRGVGIVQIICHAPAFAVGGILVEKYVLPIEHIQHGEPALRLCLVHGGQVDIRPALFGAVDRRVTHAPFFDHGASFLSNLPAKGTGGKPTPFIGSVAPCGGNCNLYAQRGGGTIWNALRFALRIISGKNIINFAFVAACGPLQTHFHGRGRDGERHLR